MVIWYYAVGICYVILIMWLIYDEFVTRYRLSINQKKWDEYCKNLTKYERRKEIMPWICERQIENKYSNRYIPKIDNVPYTVFELNINGEYYKGTIEEIEEKSGTDISWIDRDKLAFKSP
jgi:hypothetical protein